MMACRPAKIFEDSNMPELTVKAFSDLILSPLNVRQDSQPSLTHGRPKGHDRTRRPRHPDHDLASPPQAGPSVPASEMNIETMQPTE